MSAALKRLSWGHVLLAAALVMLAAVIAGAHELWVMFDDERAEAERRIADESKLIEEAARNVVIDDVERRIAVARLHTQAIFDDPLVDDEGLILVGDGTQFLPRVLTETTAEKSLVAELDEAVRSGRRLQILGGMGELTERARAVIAAKDDAAFVAAVRDYLEHRALIRTSDTADVTLTLWVVDALLDRGNADPALLRAILQDGTRVGAARVHSVQNVALKARQALDPDGAMWVHDAVVARSKRANVDADTFQQRWRDLERPPLSLPPIEPHQSVGLALAELPGELVYLRGTAEKNAEGLRVALKDAQLLVENDLRKRALLRDDEQIAIVPSGDAAIVRATLDSPRLREARARINDRDEVKRTLLVVTGLLAFGVVFAAAAELRRRKRYEDLRTGFLAAVSHELRTPLASMRLIVDSLLARTDRTSDARGSERLERLGRDVDGLDFLVENVLSFSRLERGRLEPRRDRTSLAEIVSDATEAARAGTTQDEVDVRIAIDNECVLAADPELLGLVVSNLVRNAWQHNAKPPESGAKRVDVKVSLSDDGRVGRVDVTDDGPGISDADRPRIFQEFVRGARPTTRGTGLGLALCRQIARVHGGDVTLTSTSAAGSTFTLTVPVR